MTNNVGVTRYIRCEGSNGVGISNTPDITHKSIFNFLINISFVKTPPLITIVPLLEKLAAVIMILIYLLFMIFARFSIGKFTIRIIYPFELHRNVCSFFRLSLPLHFYSSISHPRLISLIAMRQPWKPGINPITPGLMRYQAGTVRAGPIGILDKHDNKESLEVRLRWRVESATTRSIAGAIYIRIAERATRVAHLVGPESFISVTSAIGQCVGG